MVDLSNVTQSWVNVLVPYLKNYSSKLTASEISRERKISQQTASRILNNLVDSNLLKYDKKGKNKLFYLDLSNERSRTLVNVLENWMALNFQVENKISLVVNEILNFCEGVVLFGSYASGKNKSDSDLDLVILGKSDKEKIKKIKEKQILEINEHYFSYSEFEKLIAKGNAFSIEILSNHVLFGDVSKLVKIFWRYYGKK